MASRVLYPPTVNSYMPAFVAGSSAYCRVYFSLSKFNSSSDFKSVHISVTKQDSGASVVNTENGSNRFRATGIIIPKQGNDIVVQVAENLFYVDILNEDISNGWTSGWIYKIQLRLSSIECELSDGIGLADWINANASNFSEWSTICVIKAIGINNITIPAFNYDSAESNANKDTTLSLSTLDITGSYSNTDNSEKLYSYKMRLLDSSNVLEESDILYSSQYINANQFAYTFKTELKQDKNYIFELEYSTNNKYNGKVKIPFQVIYAAGTVIDAVLISAETGAESLAYAEEEEGRIALQVYSPKDEIFSGNLCIRRASAADNFTKWEDIKILTVGNKKFNEIGTIYDYTAISGIEYKYGIQSIDENTGARGILNEMKKPIKREYHYSYLLGENGQQLKLKFNNTLSNYKTAVSDTRTDTIGGKYPFITRNGNMYYKNFSINGLISYNMDENYLFVPKDFMGREVEDFYDYTYEREFRDEVLKFLYDGKPKLFKSPTEGNVLVRLTDVQATPEQAISRMIYSFSANAWEIDEPIMESFVKYNLTSIGEPSSDYMIYNTEERIGQLNGTFSNIDNLLELIYDKYSTEEGQKTLGLVDKVIKISNLSITFLSNPQSYGDTYALYGWSLNINGNNFYINSNNPTFVPGVDFYPGEKIYFNPAMWGDKTFEAEINFIYTIEQQVYKEKVVKSQTYTKGVGQISGNYTPGSSIYNDIYYKYLLIWDNQFRQIDTLYTIKIEADAGAAFLIKDRADTGEGDIIVINDTNTLILDNVVDIDDIVYKGRMVNGELSEVLNSDVLIDYYYYLAEGVYKEG